MAVVAPIGEPGRQGFAQKPFPYTNVKSYKRTLRNPLPHWILPRRSSPPSDGKFPAIYAKRETDSRPAGLGLGDHAQSRRQRGSPPTATLVAACESSRRKRNVMFIKWIYAATNNIILRLLVEMWIRDSPALWDFDFGLPRATGKTLFFYNKTRHIRFSRTSRLLSLLGVTSVHTTISSNRKHQTTRPTALTPSTSNELSRCWKSTLTSS